MKIITIDGPAGAGKSTVSRELARRLGYTYLDTGAMYRVIAYAAKEKGISPEDENGLEKLCCEVDITFSDGDIFLNGKDVSAFIRTPEIDALSSAVSRIGAVRRHLARLQRDIGKQGKVVAEGRDMGTVIFPEAEHKFFLTASVEERARRRKLQLGAKGEPVSLELLTQQIRKRDEADSIRDLAPLAMPSDAHLVDSSDLTANEVIEKMLSVIQKEGGDTDG